MRTGLAKTTWPVASQSLRKRFHTGQRRGRGDESGLVTCPPVAGHQPVPDSTRSIECVPLRSTHRPARALWSEVHRIRVELPSAPLPASFICITPSANTRRAVSVTTRRGRLPLSEAERRNEATTSEPCSSVTSRHRTPRLAADPVVAPMLIMLLSPRCFAQRAH